MTYDLWPMNYDPPPTTYALRSMIRPVHHAGICWQMDGVSQYGRHLGDMTWEFEEVIFGPFPGLRQCLNLYISMHPTNVWIQYNPPFPTFLTPLNGDCCMSWASMATVMYLTSSVSRVGVWFSLVYHTYHIHTIHTSEPSLYQHVRCYYNALLWQILLIILCLIYDILLYRILC